MRPLLYHAFLVLLFIPSSILAQSTSVKGIVKDKQSNELLIGASVIIKGTTTGTVTNTEGRFELKTSQPLPFTIQVSYIGYETQELNIADNKELVIQLKPNQYMLDAAEIRELHISEKQKMSPLTVESMDALAVKQMPAADFYEGLSHLKGVDITSASLGFKVINTRGFNSTSPVRTLQLIDGVDNQSPGLNFSLGNFLGAPELDIQRVDLIAGASSAFYGPNAFNGVINMMIKDPFIHQGLTVQAKAGERSLFESAVRWADVIRNKDSIEKFAYKINLFYLRANDWEANNDDPTPASVGKDNWGGYDAVNRYGDERNENENDYTSRSGQYQNPGLGKFYREGYWESDIVDYNTDNFKFNTALHYRLMKSTELIYAFNLGYGSTVYQGQNRYALKNILFYQNRLELKKKDKYFIRAYATQEDAGDSYDAVFTALLLQESGKNFSTWTSDYVNYWSTTAKKRVQKLPDYCIWVPGEDFDSCLAHNQVIMDSYSDSLFLYHELAREYANNKNGQRFKPGTPEFEEELRRITSTSLFEEGGTRFYDKSALYHVQGEYKFTPSFADIVTGGNYRLYRPDSRGTIFSDTSGREITNQEIGIYAGIEKKLIDENLILKLTGRADKNENFPLVFSPAFSAVYNFNENHYLRASFSSAIRNPTLSDQYLYYNVGRAMLLGNLEGYDSLVTVQSFYDYLDGWNTDTLTYFDINPIEQEKVKTVEIGYRGIIKNSIYIDANVYQSFYRDFIGYLVGIDLEYDQVRLPTYVQAYQISANSSNGVVTRGFSIALSYYWRNYTIGGNYSWNKLVQEKDDPLIPAFNTPEHKYNISLGGRDIKFSLGKLDFKQLGFQLNYRWVEGFEYVGSPQFTGFVPSYDLVDAQVNKTWPKYNTTLKLGASNLLNNEKFQVYGGPRIGRLAYVALRYELPK